MQEGWTMAEMGEYLEEAGILSAREFVNAASVTDISDILPGESFSILDEKPNGANLEGFLFPDTYRIFKDSTAADIIKKQLNTLDEKIDDEVMDGIEKSGHTFFEILTMASVLEKEVKSRTDMALAADIFWRRIEAGIPMESDATVNYVTGKDALQPTLADTKVDSPYNTYENRGLPPGPISNPSLSAIKAAVYPESNIYWYFLTRPDGTTVFSKNFEEHLENKSKYLK
jgi:UPF0755 protein